MNDLLTFVISFLTPLVFARSISHIAKKHMRKPYIRTKTKLMIHHSDEGIILILIASLILLFWEKNILVIILLGLGLGFMFDLFIPSLLLKTNRKEELEIYHQTFKKTLILFAIIILMVFILSLII